MFFRKALTSQSIPEKKNNNQPKPELVNPNADGFESYFMEDGTLLTYPSGFVDAEEWDMDMAEIKASPSLTNKR